MCLFLVNAGLSSIVDSCEQLFLEVLLLDLLLVDDELSSTLRHAESDEVQSVCMHWRRMQTANNTQIGVHTGVGRPGTVLGFSIN